MGIKHLQGTSCNIEYQQVRHEDERRRDKRRCDYYGDNNRCLYKGMLYCCGSGKCDVYKEKSDDASRRLFSGKSASKDKVNKLLPKSTVVRIRNCETNDIESHKVVYKSREIKTTEILYNSFLAKMIANSRVGDVIEVNSKKYQILSINKPCKTPSIDKVISKRKKKKRSENKQNKMFIAEKKQNETLVNKVE